MKWARLFAKEVGAVHKLCRLGKDGGEGGSPKDDLLHRPLLIKKTTMGEELKNCQFWDDIVYGRPLGIHK